MHVEQYAFDSLGKKDLQSLLKNKWLHALFFSFKTTIKTTKLPFPDGINKEQEA